MRVRFSKIIKKVLGVTLSTCIFATQLSVFAYSEPDTTGWIEWKIPDDSKSFGSAIDASFTLDAPAGKHGFASPSGENIVFEDGTEVSFWGTNVSMAANFGTHEHSEALADRIARLGYNIVRFHHMDHPTKANIFSSGGNGSTLEVDSVQMEKLFYFLSCLKERGIYYYMDLIVSRGADKNDGIAEYKSVENGWGSYKFFDERMIELQKEYARQLLTTKNPYTGLSLAEDPAMVFIDITNESTLLKINTTNMPDHYFNQLNTLFNDYLKTKYSNTDKLRQSWGALNDGENLENGTISIGRCTVPNDYASLGYSSQRELDTYTFLYETVKEFYIEMKTYLKDNLNVKCLITGTGMGGSAKRLATAYLNKEIMDYTDYHQYMSHPDDYAYNTGTTAWIQSSLRDSYMFKSGLAESRVAGQPFVIGEWSECNLNDFRAETNLMMAALASYQNWNPIHFQMTGSNRLSENGYINDSFSSYYDPLYTASSPLAAMLFNRGEVNEASTTYYYPQDKDDVLIDRGKKDYISTWKYAKIGTAFSDLAGYNKNNSSSFTKYMLDIKSGSQLSNQLYFDEDDEKAIFKVDTGKTNAVAAFNQGETISLSCADINFDNEFAVVGISSITNQNLNNTNRILVTAVARGRNTGFALEGDPAEIRMVSRGKAPVLAEPVKGSITLKTTNNITVYALDSEGHRTAKVDTTKTSAGYSKFDIKGEYDAVYYEVISGDGFITTNSNVDYSQNTITLNGWAGYQMENTNLNISIEDESGVEVKNTVAKTDAMGNYAVELSLDEFSNGRYSATTSTTSLYATDEFTVKSNRYGVSINVCTIDDVINVSGNVTYGTYNVKDKNISVMVTKQENTNLENAKKSIYYVNQQKTDDMGGFSFDVDMTEAKEGYYFITVGIKEQDAKNKIAYKYTPESKSDYYIAFYDDPEKITHVTIIADSENVTAVAEKNKYDAPDGVLVLAIYKDNVLVDVQVNDSERNTENELYVSYQLPDNTEGYMVKAFMLESFENIKPLSEGNILTR